ncbi:TetR/AcrR family transcriptional regulator [Nocardioides zeae]|uniref:TetR/AcrR family transcriptional regulator n=1 Tax=Nocardioides imazamoxiresistens TaxID=3231893 RepID=A0ABU3Q1L1_9ACTN|nr:TetR/AcrR family transcriptional regulator [Nocardioides zeae]MDT9595385.1 TetR/AcrR family transcriptional regulator [Nocardioides zeae]
MATRDDVLGAALRHLNTDATASMAAIAEAAGISRATLHRHFAKREALVRELGERSLDRWERTQDEAGIDAAGASGDAERIRDCATAMLTQLVADADEFGFTLVDEFLCTEPALLERTDRLFDREVAFWAAAQDAGVLRRDVPARWIGHAAYGLLVASRDAIRSGDVAPRDLAPLVLSTFLDGASA